MILDETQKYQIHFKKWKFAISLLLSILIFYEFPLIIYRKWQLTSVSGWLIFYVALLAIAIISSIRILKILFSDGLVLEMSDSGIETKKYGFIDWEEIDNIEVKKTSWNNTLLLIYVKKTEDFISDISKFKSKLMNKMEEEHGTPFFVNIYETDYNESSFKTALSTYFVKVNLPLNKKEIS